MHRVVEVTAQTSYAPNLWTSMHTLSTRVLFSVSLSTALLIACGNSDTKDKAPAPEVKAPAAPAPPAEPEAVVLGLRTQDGALVTLFGGRAAGAQAAGGPAAGGQSTLTQIGPGIAVPRKDGWWKFNVIKQVDTSGKYQENQLVAAKAGEPLTPVALQSMEGCTQEMKSTVLFVGNDQVSVELESYSNCEGAAHPNTSHELGTYALDALKDNSKLGLDKVLGQEAFKQFVTDGTAARANMKDADCMETPESAGWGVLRKGGHWSLRGGATHTLPPCQGRLELFDVKMPPPQTLVGHDALPREFAAYKAEDATIKDVVASPSGAVEVRISATGASLWEGGKQVASYPAPGASIVMAQWAVGEKNVSRWREEVQKTLAP